MEEIFLAVGISVIFTLFFVTAFRKPRHNRTKIIRRVTRVICALDHCPTPEDWGEGQDNDRMLLASIWRHVENCSTCYEKEFNLRLRGEIASAKVLEDFEDGKLGPAPEHVVQRAMDLFNEQAKKKLH